MAAIGAIFLAFPQIFIRIFTTEVDVIETGIVYLRFLSPTFGFIAFSLILGRALNGAGDTFSPMVITLAAQVGVGLGLVILLSHFIGTERRLVRDRSLKCRPRDRYVVLVSYWKVEDDQAC